MNRFLLIFLFGAACFMVACTINDPPYVINEEGERVYSKIKSVEEDKPAKPVSQKKKKVETIEISVNKADTGEDVTLQLVYYVPPYYPEEARADGIEGDVEVEFGITDRGLTRDVRIVDTDHPDVFDYIVLDIVRRWRFLPQSYNDTSYRLVLGFEL